MKNIILFLAFCMCVTSANAQWEDQSYLYGPSPGQSIINDMGGKIQVGLASYPGHYSAQAAINDGVIRVLNGGNLIFNMNYPNIESKTIIFASEEAKLMQVKGTGQVLIGNTNTPSGYKLYVESGILTEKVKVAVKNTTNWADYVFDKKYKLLSLKEVEKYVKINKHLPNVPSAEEVVKEGIDMATMDAKLLEKIEELTLYVIQLNKKTEQLEKANKATTSKKGE
jgi:hypothetical protein